ncbi:hypothetical protein F2Q69_00030901 [Brassica cretica]|uniref:F-box associated beta-propeller type 1 domain-containing protein n=1 Tax=Brassica cretica TaxID=69181 RepID=A0A8S9RYD0_BRACR|nr:hypothetical protein F2Q69_00030901 [Brassica cretica]
MVTSKERVDIDRFEVTREEQKLCLLASGDKVLHIDVWMATEIKSTGDMSWSKLLTVKQTHLLLNGMSFLADRENKVIVYDDDPTLVQIQQGSLGLGTWKAPTTGLVIVTLVYALLTKFS